MSAISLQYTPDFSRNFSHGRRRLVLHDETSSSCTVRVCSKCTHPHPSKEKEFSEKLQKLSVPETEKCSPLLTDGFQRTNRDETCQEDGTVGFGQFVAREARIDEEYWAAAWLRAEAHWEEKIDERFADNHKRKFAEQEFNALKSRCKVQLGEKCICIVVVKKEDQTVKRSVLSSVVATLDLTIGYLSNGESFPGEWVKAPMFCLVDGKELSKYGYIANLCVSKLSRRNGIARNMMRFAISLAQMQGLELVYVHVHRGNKPAQHLYQNVGFKVVEAASSQLSSDHIHLLCFKTNRDIRLSCTYNNV